MCFPLRTPRPHSPRPSSSSAPAAMCVSGGRGAGGAHVGVGGGRFPRQDGATAEQPGCWPGPDDPGPSFRIRARTPISAGVGSQAPVAGPGPCGRMGLAAGLVGAPGGGSGSCSVAELGLSSGRGRGVLPRGPHLGEVELPRLAVPEDPDRHLRPVRQG